VTAKRLIAVCVLTIALVSGGAVACSSSESDKSSTDVAELGPEVAKLRLEVQQLRQEVESLRQEVAIVSPTTTTPLDGSTPTVSSVPDTSSAG
jgi:outer membrane murein-binding lipoprotein Lpp